MDNNPWFGDRDDTDKAMYAGWRQHFLQLLGFLAQQYYADYRYAVIKKMLTRDCYSRSQFQEMEDLADELEGEQYVYLERKKKEYGFID